MWSVLFVTLPTRPTAVRVRIWRALKALGSPLLRDGAYLLPQDHEALFEPLAEDVRAHGGSALVLRLAPPSARQRDELLALFDRSTAYAAWRSEALALQGRLGERSRLAEAEARRRLRGLAQALEDLGRIDYYPGAAATQAQALLATLREALDARFARGEPRAGTAHRIPRLAAREFQGKRWATRARPWVDRLASAWLIARFIDPQARFLWLADVTRLPRGAVGFDFDGARFTHVGARVTFEVLAAAFGLEDEPRLRRIGAAVRYLDAGGIPVPEAAGLEAVLAGLREQHADDDRLRVAAGGVFDALWAAPANP